MPRVSAAHRQARRDQIAEAALRVLQRHGVADTSIALIAEECGLSTGAIYANFENKAELARYIASSRLGWRTERLDRLAVSASASGSVVTPPQVLQALLDQLAAEQPLPLVAVLQFWSAAAVEPDLHEVLAEHVDRLRASVQRVLQPWADRYPDDPDLASRTSHVCLAMCQGFVTQCCLYGWLDAVTFVRAAAAVFAEPSLTDSRLGAPDPARAASRS